MDIGLQTAPKWWSLTLVGSCISTAQETPMTLNGKSCNHLLSSCSLTFTEDFDSKYSRLPVSGAPLLPQKCPLWSGFGAEYLLLSEIYKVYELVSQKLTLIWCEYPFMIRDSSVIKSNEGGSTVKPTCPDQSLVFRGAPRGCLCSESCQESTA